MLLSTCPTQQLMRNYVQQQVVLYNLPDMLHKLIPGYVGGIQMGAVTPSGLVNPYNINGLQAWVISNGLFLANAFYFHWFSPTVVFDNRGGLFWTANLTGVVLAIFAIVKVCDESRLSFQRVLFTCSKATFRGK